jgi:indole-3-glycerol phosphate synthase
VSILNKIFSVKQEEVEAAKARTSVSELKDLAAAQPATPFRRALKDSRHPVSLVAEVKKASPSQGMIRPDFDPVEVAKSYQRVGADCLSVLTDEPYFQGKPEYLRSVKAATGMPCLRKDFIFDPYQVYEARAWGADAVLLIAAYLDRSQLECLQAEIRGQGMDALVEVHTELEAEIVVNLECDLVVVNNRSLHDFRTDLAQTERIAPILRQGLPNAVVVSESALETHADVRRAAQAGARSVLIGTTFCASPDIEGKVREVMAWQG